MCAVGLPTVYLDGRQGSHGYQKLLLPSRNGERGKAAHTFGFKTTETGLYVIQSVCRPRLAGRRGEKVARVLCFITGLALKLGIKSSLVRPTKSLPNPVLIQAVSSHYILPPEPVI